MQCLALYLAIFGAVAIAQKDPHFVGDKNTIVHLFEWKWTDIAAECENFLSKTKFGGVQISPPNENLVMGGRPWYERYQPVSFVLITRSGNATTLQDMIARCNKVGIRIYVDVLLNDMAGGEGRGTANNLAFPGNKSYPGVPFTDADFHPTCAPIDYQNATSIRVCELESLKDLNQTIPRVRNILIEYMNQFIEWGVAGFRIDAAKHMFPEDLEYMFGRLNNLSTDYFPAGSKAFIYQEITDQWPEAVKNTDYVGFGRIVEFKCGIYLGQTFRKQFYNLSQLSNWGTQWGLVEGEHTLVMINNHDNQRSDPETILSYKTPKLFKAALAFMLAHNYSGTTRVMSNFNFTTNDDGPPSNDKYEITSPVSGNDTACTEGWICEHRWNAIVNMIEFRTVVNGTNLTNWWSNSKNQIAFGRGDKGFVAFNIEGDLEETLNTGLPEGVYCDVISGQLVNGTCTGKNVSVDSQGYAKIVIKESDENAVLMLHVYSSNGHMINAGPKLFCSLFAISFLIVYNY